MEKITKIVELTIPRTVAFSKFLDDINAWWPKEYTWSQEKLEEIRIEEKQDGLCTEIGPHGFRCDWGRVTELIKNQKISLKWQISPNREPVPNPENASDIELVFEEKGSSASTLWFEHKNFQNHTGNWKAYLDAMDSPQGWDYILERFQQFCEEY